MRTILLGAALALAGCSPTAAPPVATQAAPTAQAAATTPSAPAAEGVLAPTPTPTPTPTPSAAVSPPASPTSASYWSARKLAEGGHGGPPLLDLPKAIAIDYRVSGSCVFSLGLATETSDVGLPGLTMTVTGPEVAGTWRLSIRPGPYYPVVGEAVGCVYSVNVRDDR